AEDGIRDWSVTGVQTCALPIFDDPALVEGAAETSASGIRGHALALVGMVVGCALNKGGIINATTKARGTTGGREPYGKRPSSIRSEERRVGKEGRSRR